MKQYSQAHLSFVPSPKLLGSDLFLSDSSSRATLSILSDKGAELTGWDKRSLLPNGHTLISDLLSSPLKDAGQIKKRQEVIGTMASLEHDAFDELQRESLFIGYLFSECLSDELRFEDFLRFAEKLSNIIEKRSPSNPNGPWSLGLDYDTVDSIGKLIPKHITKIKALGGEFYLSLAMELDTASKGLQRFPIYEIFTLVQKLHRVNKSIDKLRYGRFHEKHTKRLKSIAGELIGTLSQIYGKYRDAIQKFCDIYCVPDAIIILSSHIRSDRLSASKISTDMSEVGSEIRDGRLLLGTRMVSRSGDDEDRRSYQRGRDTFQEYVPNALSKSTYPLEFYSGGNGSGKSAWLKTRLSLQLFHQTFGYVAGAGVSLPIRENIIFMNRGGSGYAENLSAFGSDIDKLKRVIPGEMKNSLFIFDEFGSTIPEGEAYALSRGLIEYLQEGGAKTIFSTHNERLIRDIESGELPGSFIGHFPTKYRSRGEVLYSRKLIQGADIAHTLSVFGAVGFDKSILSKARIAIVPELRLPRAKPQTLKSLPLSRYTPEEREVLKAKKVGYAGLSRAIDVSHWADDRGQQGWHLSAPIPEGRSDYALYPNHSIANNEHTMRQDARNSYSSPQSLELLGSFGSSGVRFPYQIYPEKHYGKFSYCSDALKGILSFGMTSDPRELYERQQLFRELQTLDEEEINTLSDYVSSYRYLISDFQLPRKKEHSFYARGGLRCDFGELKTFNTVLWDEVFQNKQYHYHKLAFIETVFELLKMESILGNVDTTFYKKHEAFFKRLTRYKNLLERLERIERRERNSWQLKDEWNGIHEKSLTLAPEIKKRVETLLAEEFGSEEESLSKVLSELEEVVRPLPGHDISKLSPEKRHGICEIARGEGFFQKRKRYLRDSRESIFDWYNPRVDLIKIIKYMDGEGGIFDPIIAKLRTLDSTHAHQIASYIEGIAIMPRLEVFRDRVIRRMKDPLFLTNTSSYSNPRYKKEKAYILPECPGDSTSFSPYMVLNDLCGLVYTAKQIQKLGWKEVTYNQTGEIDIRGMTHPGKEKLPKEQQVPSDLALKTSEHFDILEGATMGGKTMHIQSVTWLMRLAHSIGYAPVESASIPLFDGIIYLDRILEDEKAGLSAGQKDAQYWKELIDKVILKVSVIGTGGKYWWAIDEMISSVPSRYQRGLVVAILEKLKSLGQKGQISIHNPDFVSKILDLDPASYSVHHPEITTSADGKIVSTHKIVPGRSRDRDGNFSAFSLETAEAMGLERKIIEKARIYRERVR